ncbi:MULTISPECIES: hypothetical protein [unclassified Streptomyces]
MPADVQPGADSLTDQVARALRDHLRHVWRPGRRSDEEPTPTPS